MAIIEANYVQSGSLCSANGTFPMCLRGLLQSYVGTLGCHKCKALLCAKLLQYKGFEFNIDRCPDRSRNPLRLTAVVFGSPVVSVERIQTKAVSGKRGGPAASWRACDVE